MNRLDISVVIPVYNSRDTLDRCLDSVARQTLQCREVILVDDHSSDGLEECVVHYLNRFDDGIYHRIPVQSGSPALPRNIGIDIAKSDIVAFLDADDFWLPHHLEHAMFGIEQRGFGLVCSQYILLSDFTSNLPRETLDEKWTTITTQQLCWQNSVVTSSVVALKEVLPAEELFPVRNGIFEDYSLWLRISTTGCIGLSTRETVVYDNSDRPRMSDRHRSEAVCYVRTLRASMTSSSLDSLRANFSVIGRVGIFVICLIRFIAALAQDLRSAVSERRS